MGKLIERRYVVEIDGFVAAAPYAHFEDALECARSFGVLVSVATIRCYWGKRVLWEARGEDLLRVAPFRQRRSRRKS